MSTLYPLKFTPILKEKIWGGQKLNTLLKIEIQVIKRVSSGFWQNGDVVYYTC